MHGADTRAARGASLRSTPARATCCRPPATVWPATTTGSSWCQASHARELSGPCRAARDAESAEAFQREWLTTRVRREWFGRLLRYWVCEAPAAFDRLQRSRSARSASGDIEQQVRWGLQSLFVADAAQVVARLLAIVEDAAQRTLTRRGLVERLARRGCRPRRLYGPDRAGDAVESATTATWTAHAGPHSGSGDAAGGGGAAQGAACREPRARAS